MKNCLFLLAVGLLLVAGAAHGFPQVRPNCPVSGNWTDPDGRRQMWLSQSLHTDGVTEEMGLNTTSALIHHALTRPANNSILGEPNTAMVYYLSNVTLPDGLEEQESVVVQAKCVNDLLWVTVIPLSEESIYGHITTFTLRRQAVQALSEAPPPSSVTPNPHPPSGAQAHPPNPQFILVNVTLPQRQEDDNLYYMEDLFQKDEDSDTSQDDENLNRVLASSIGQSGELEE